MSGERILAFPVWSDLAGYEKTHWYILTRVGGTGWVAKWTTLLGQSPGAKEIIFKNLKWQHDPTTYWVSSIALMEGTDFTWDAEACVPGTGSIINTWQGLDPDNEQNYIGTIKEMDTRYVVKYREIRLTYNVYCRVEGGSTAKNVGNIITFDTYVKYLT